MLWDLHRAGVAAAGRGSSARAARKRCATRCRAAGPGPHPRRCWAKRANQRLAHRYSRRSAPKLRRAWSQRFWMPSTLDFPPPSDLFGAATGGGVGSEVPRDFIVARVGALLDDGQALAVRGRRRRAARSPIRLMSRRRRATAGSTGPRRATAAAATAAAGAPGPTPTSATRRSPAATPRGSPGGPRGTHLLVSRRRRSTAGSTGPRRATTTAAAAAAGAPGPTPTSATRRSPAATPRVALARPL